MNVTAPGIGPQLATQGLQAMFDPNVTGIQDQARIGDSYCQQIQVQSTVPVERAVAGTGLSAWSQMSLATCQVGIMEATLDAIQAGVGGPVGTALGTVGLSAMFNKDITQIQDQAKVGEAYVDSVATQSEDATQRAVCSTAQSAWRQMRYATAQVGVDEAALDFIKSGASGPADKTLAHVGYSAMYNKDISNIQDQAVIGLVFTAGVRNNATDPALQAQAQAALNAANNVQTANDQVDILGNFLGQVH